MRTFNILLLLAAIAEAQAPPRPRITGVAHVAFYASDVDKTRAFYRDLLGYQEPFKMNKAQLDNKYRRPDDEISFADRDTGADAGLRCGGLRGMGN